MLGTVRTDRERGHLLLVTFVDLVDDLVDDLDWGPLVVLAGSLIDELRNLILKHFFFSFLSCLLTKEICDE